MAPPSMRNTRSMENASPMRFTSPLRVRLIRALVGSRRRRDLRVVEDPSFSIEVEGRRRRRCRGREIYDLSRREWCDKMEVPTRPVREGDDHALVVVVVPWEQDRTVGEVGPEDLCTSRDEVHIRVPSRARVGPYDAVVDERVRSHLEERSFAPPVTYVEGNRVVGKEVVP